MTPCVGIAGWKPAAILIAAVWVLVTSVEAARSHIVLANADGYVQDKFRVTKLYYSNKSRSGLFWGFEGSVRNRPERYYAMALADARELGENGLRNRYPPGVLLDVW